ncbi:MAG: hypothetical protein IMF11_00400 [Proteobacteria bacterium]|nr:hypothetical protein [Pseudomonadota bacterium]
MRKLISTLAIIMCLVCFMANARAAQITISDDAFLNIHGYIQGWLYMPIDHDGKDPAIITDFYLRRARLLFGGQVIPDVNFFIGTLNGNMGKDGDMSPRTLIADAWVEYAVADYLKVNAGLLKLPFSRHMQQSGAKLHGLDFHGSFLKRSGVAIPHRDMGVMVRGLLSDKKIDYRLAVLDGKEYASGDTSATPPVPVTNKDDMPRIVGRIGYNVFDPEPGYFWAGTYLGKKKVLSFGASFDIQPGVGGDEGDELYYAFAFDAFADIPMEENGIVGTLNAYYFGPGGIIPEGCGLWGDFGYRMENIEPLVAFEWYEPNEGDTGKHQAVLGGFNWWIRGHNVNVKFQLGADKLNGADEWTKTAIVQSQVFF